MKTRFPLRGILEVAVIIILCGFTLYSVIYCGTGQTIAAIAFQLLAFGYLAYRLWLNGGPGNISAAEAQQLDEEAGFRLDEHARPIPLTYQVKVLEIMTPIMAYDLGSFPAAKDFEVPIGEYEVRCVASLSPEDTYWFKCNGDDWGLPPLELEALLLNRQAQWAKK